MDLKGAVLKFTDRYNGNSNSINIYISGGRSLKQIGRGQPRNKGHSK